MKFIAVPSFMCQFVSELHKHPLVFDVIYPLLSQHVHFVRLYHCTMYGVFCSLL